MERKIYLENYLKKIRRTVAIFVVIEWIIDAYNCIDHVTKDETELKRNHWIYILALSFLVFFKSVFR